ncbi:MAG: hypothetical protein HYU77_13785 [Betaproteobacteria bacterium]|nr:hypothetical protein [Betaproteobacteria bacterium]
MDPFTIALGLAQFAPSIMRFFGAGERPVAVAEKLVGMAQAVTGAQTPEAALEAMRQNAQFQHDFQMAVLKENTALEQLYLADRQSARARDVEVRRLNQGSNTRADLMLISAFVAVVVIAAILALGQVDPGSAVAGFLFSVGGMFARNIGTAFDFEFGSSRGSKEKDAILSEKALGK